MTKQTASENDKPNCIAQSEHELDWRKASISEIIAYTVLIGSGLALVNSNTEQLANTGEGLVTLTVFLGSLKLVFVFFGKVGVFVGTALFIVAMFFWSEHLFQAYLDFYRYLRTN